MEDKDLLHAILLLNEKRPQDAFLFLQEKLTSSPRRESFQRLSDDALCNRIFKDDPLDLNRDRLLKLFERVCNFEKPDRVASTLWLQKLVPDLTDREGHYFLSKHYKMFSEKSFMAKAKTVVPEGQPSKHVTRESFIAKALHAGLTSEQATISYDILFSPSSPL